MFKSDQEILQLIEAECVTLVAQGLSVQACFNKEIYQEWIAKVIEDDNGNIFQKVLELGYEPIPHLHKILWVKTGCGKAFVAKNFKYMKALQCLLTESAVAYISQRSKSTTQFATQLSRPQRVLS